MKVARYIDKMAMNGSELEFKKMYGEIVQYVV